MRISRWVTAFLTLAATFTVAQSAPPLNQIVDRLEAAQSENHANLRPYTVTREFRILSGDHNEKTDSEVKATVNFIPPDKQTFNIDSTSGSERGVAAVKRILESETELRDSRESAAFTRDNYDFTYEGAEEDNGRPCYILGLTPRHKEHHLIKGRLWVDARTFLPHKVDGDLAKSPSWWVKQVHITTDFRDVNGMWLPTTTSAIADLRIFGKRTLTSQAMNFNTGEQVARVMPPNAIRHEAAATPSPAAAHPAVRRRPTRPVLLGTGVLVNQ